MLNPACVYSMLFKMSVFSHSLSFVFLVRVRGDCEREDEPCRTDSDWRSIADPQPDRNGYNDSKTVK